ncbi:epididymal-specific lipocalin-9 [Ochotona princeps]|uniref:epididymal-specific lipocalin-9 n=1 Tax=Ochotona princeps TaxID=9978 RepID=UPI0027148D07|nr:epididymal-specific lipocalin-9 [Ochotona princeps]
MALLLLLLGLLGLLRLWPGLEPSPTTAQELNLRSIVQNNYNMARVSGIWYSISVASSNLTRFREHGDLRVFVRRLEHLDNGSLKFDLRFRVQGQCVPVIMIGQRTGKDGEYLISYQGDNRVLVLETDYSLFIILYLNNTQGQTKTQALALYGRTPHLSSPFLKRFEEACKRFGLDPGTILLLRGQDNCYHER